MKRLFIKAVAAFLVLPFSVAFLIPIFIGYPYSSPSGSKIIAVPVLILGSLILVHCIERFYSEGKGTLAPWSPPKHLVVTGLYRYSRNPMYLGVLMVILGWSIFFHSIAILVYAMVVFIAFHLRITTYEEIQMKKLFPKEWKQYAADTFRWIGRK